MDTVDQMCSVHNCARITNRWPMVVFYHMMNCASINAYVLYRLLHPDLQGEARSRHDFLEELIFSLTRPQIELRRAHPEQLRQHTVDAMKLVGMPSIFNRVQRVPGVRLPQYRCQFCPRGDRSKTTRLCNECAACS